MLTTKEFERELAEKNANLTLSELLMLGFATGRTPNDYHAMFEFLLERPLTGEEQIALENLEGEQYLRVEACLGPLVAEASA